MSLPVTNSNIGPVNLSGPIIWQPVMSPPQKDLKINVSAIKFFSYSCIFLGIASIAIQTAALVVDSLGNDFLLGINGICAGCFYIITGSLGVAAATKQTRPLLIGTIVMSSLSVPASATAALFSALSGSVFLIDYCYAPTDPDYLCSISPLMELEWTLVAIIILSFFSVTTLLILTSKALRCCCKTKNTVVHFVTSTQQPYVLTSNKPIYFQPQPTQLVQQTTSQVYVGQPIQPLLNSYSNIEHQYDYIEKPPPYEF